MYMYVYVCNMCIETMDENMEHTIFPRLNASAFVCFMLLWGAVSISGQHLFEGGVD